MTEAAAMIVVALIAAVSACYARPRLARRPRNRRPDDPTIRDNDHG